MKKMILAAAIIVSPLLAEVVTIAPYRGEINYDKNQQKSVKDYSTIYGLYTSIGTLRYLLQLNYSHFMTKYKKSFYLIPTLNQNDITLAYGYYFPKFMLRIGVHDISTNDVQLGNGIIALASINGYDFIGYDKYSYGLKGYYSFYKKGHNEKYIAKSIEITQLTPYFTAYDALSINWGNSFTLKANYEIAPDYIKKHYLSYSASDTIFYKNFLITFSGYGGKMRTGVTNNGFTVANTLDLMKTGYGVTIAYHFTKKMLLSLSYGINNYREYGKLQDGSNSVSSASFSYKL